ncbi:hypothetical protein H4219_000387 [Mycoemilia scoparia]|uniref:Pyridoxal phosphate homeostasis protein n=1 Tax=Mycoemilia scoparia TaxID=417184 RepID=A0A9W8A918_9FUNG|nr:hypothetical protein H4219_000387 [Mycoemilia scoparia]
MSATDSQVLVENYKSIISVIESKKQSQDARLVAVSKYKPASDIGTLYKSGQLHFGENYVQELVSKAEVLPKEIKWHFIGGLQTNKCKALAAIPNLWAVETIGSEKHALKMNQACEAAGRKEPLNVFVQVNTSNEENKSGESSEKAIDLASFIEKNCSHLHLLGLMTIGSVENSNKEPNPDFLLMKNLQERLQKLIGRPVELSMGMSHDFEHALCLGSTNVRVGSSIFGQRAPKA